MQDYDLKLCAPLEHIDFGKNSHFKCPDVRRHIIISIICSSKSQTLVFPSTDRRPIFNIKCKGCDMSKN